MFRQKPLETLIPEAYQKGVGLLVRLPLASGLLTGKFTSDHVFEANDHRRFNENGEAFNVGETFAGLGFHKGVELADGLKWIAEGRKSMASAALRWILDQKKLHVSFLDLKMLNKSRTISLPWIQSRFQQKKSKRYNVSIRKR